MYQATPPSPPPPAFPAPAGAAPPYQRPRRPVPMLLPHLIWEAVLLLLVLAVCTAALIWTPLLGGRGIWGTLAIGGLLASALALSLRTGTPNLAVAGLAAMSGMVFAELLTGAGIPWVVAAAVAMAAVLLVGAVLGLVAGLTSAPAWAVSLGGLAVTQAVVFSVSDTRGLPVSPGPPLGGVAWFVTFVVISLAGGALLAVPPVRRLFSANRTSGDPVRFTGRRLVGALAGFVGSSALAGLAGIAAVNHFRSIEATFWGIDWLLIALAAALLGGVSAFGGRGGLAGTVFGTVLVMVALSWLSFESLFEPWGRWVVIGMAILVGVGVSRLIEAIAPVEPAGTGTVPAGSAVPTGSAVSTGAPAEPAGAMGGPAGGPGGPPPQAAGATGLAPAASPESERPPDPEHS